MDENETTSDSLLDRYVAEILTPSWRKTFQSVAASLAKCETDMETLAKGMASGKTEAKKAAVALMAIKNKVSKAQSACEAEGKKIFRLS